MPLSKQTSKIQCIKSDDKRNTVLRHGVDLASTLVAITQAGINDINQLIEQVQNCSSRYLSLFAPGGQCGARCQDCAPHIGDGGDL